MIHENCGVVGIFSMDGINVIPFVIDCLRALQHRGQEAWGVAVPHRIPLKRIGLVSSSASEFASITRKFESHAAIGHVRYSTTGKSTLNNAQPIKVKELCIAHNGTIANVDQLTSMVGGCSFTPQSMTDTLVASTASGRSSRQKKRHNRGANYFKTGNDRFFLLHFFDR